MIEMLSGQGHALSDLLAAAGLPRSTYYRARSHPPRPTRPELWEKVAEVFSRTANGCGHRQVAMALRAEEDASATRRMDSHRSAPNSADSRKPALILTAS